MTEARERLHAQCEASGLAVTRSGLEATSPIGLLADYLVAMLEENQRVNLTAIRNAERASLLHAADSLALGDLPGASGPALDLGTGNGFPGVALAAIQEGLDVALCDRTRRKIRAIERALDAASWPGTRRGRVSPEWLDAEQAPATKPDWVHRFGRITARAVATPEVCLALAKPLLEKDGDVVLWLSEETASQHTLPKSAGWRSEDHRYTLRHADGREERTAVLRRYLRS